MREHFDLRLYLDFGAQCALRAVMVHMAVEDNFQSAAEGSGACAGKTGADDLELDSGFWYGSLLAHTEDLVRARRSLLGLPEVSMMLGQSL